MSTRLIVPTTSIEYSRMCPQIPKYRVKTARRALFGKPNPEETKNFLNVAFDMQQKKFAEKYSFDLVKEAPIVGPTAKYVYLECKIIEAPRKKRLIDEVEESDENYFKPEDFINRLGQDCNIQSPIQLENQCKDVRKDKKQRCITDYMATKKRNTTAMEKSEKVHPAIPTIAKLADLNG